MNDDEVTAAEASKILGVTPHHVRWYFTNGHLEGRRVGGLLLVFKRADVEKLKDNKPKKPGRPKKKPAPEAAPVKKPAAKKRKGKGA